MQTSTKTHRRTLAKTHACAVFFKGGTVHKEGHGVLLIPSGLRCHMVRDGATAGKFFLDEFPLGVFPRNSIVRHDAMYYGVMLERSQVKDITIIA